MVSHTTLTMFKLLLFVLLIEYGLSVTCGSRKRRCAVNVGSSQPTEPLYNVTLSSHSGMVSLGIRVDEEGVNFNAKLFSLTLIGRNGSDLSLSLGESGSLLLSIGEGTYSTNLRRCKGHCTIHIGWRESCHQRVEERHHDGETYISLSKRPVLEDFEGYNLSFVESHGSGFIVNDLTVFDYFTAHQDMPEFQEEPEVKNQNATFRRKIGRGILNELMEPEEEPNDEQAFLTWDDVLEECCQENSSFSLTPKMEWESRIKEGILVFGKLREKRYRGSSVINHHLPQCGTGCFLSKCTVRVGNHSSDPLYNLTLGSRSGMVSMDIRVDEDHVKATLFRLTMVGREIPELSLALGEDGALKIGARTGAKSLRSCHGHCRINIGWRESCYEKIEERYHDHEINILINGPLDLDAFEGYLISLVIPHGSHFWIRDLVVFDFYTSHQDMRRQVFESERKPNNQITSLKWEDVINKYCCRDDSNFFLEKDMERVFPYQYLAPPSEDIVVEYREGNRSKSWSLQNTYLYMNMDSDQGIEKSKPGKECHLNHRYLVEEALTNGTFLKQFSICFEMVAATATSHLKIIHFVTSSYKSITVMVDQGSLHLLRDLEDSQIVNIPDGGKTVVCFTVDITHNQNTTFVVYIQDENGGWKEPKTYSFGWYWIVGQGNNQVTVGLMEIGTAKHVKISNIAIWKKVISQTERELYLNDPYAPSSAKWKTWDDMLEAVVTSEELGPFFTDSRLQVITPSEEGEGCGRALALPAHAQCPQSCEYIPYWEICQTPCIDGTPLCEEEQSYNSGIDLNKVVTHKKLGENLLQNTVNVTLCVAVQGWMSGTILNYGDRSLHLHIQSTESILVIIHRSHFVFFPVQLVSQDIHRLCIRIVNGRVTAYTDGFEIEDSSFQNKIPQNHKTFGKGEVSLFVSSQDDTPVGGHVYGLNIWERGLTDDEMTIFSTLHQCLTQRNTLLSWGQVIAALEDEETLLSSQFCNNNGYGLNFLDLNEIEEFIPPPSLGKATYLIKAEQIGEDLQDRSNITTFSLGVRDELCLTVPNVHTGKKFKIIFGLENPVGLSHRVLDIEREYEWERIVENVCYFCKKTYLQINLDLEDGNKICLRDARKSMGSIAGFAVTKSTGLTINKIIMVEAKTDWACTSSEFDEHRLYGTFIWGSTDTFSDAICPHGKKANNLFIAYAQRRCLNNKYQSDIQQSGYKQCQFKSQGDNLQFLLDTVDLEKDDNVLIGKDLSVAVSRAVADNRVNSKIDAKLFKTTLAHIEKTLSQTRIEEDDICWFMDIFNAFYKSPQVDLFPQFKVRFMPDFLKGYYPHDTAKCGGEVFQTTLNLGAGEKTLSCSSREAPFCASSVKNNEYNVTMKFEQASSKNAVVTFFKNISVDGSKAFSNEIKREKLNLEVRVISDIISVYVEEKEEEKTSTDKKNGDQLKVIYTFRNIEGERWKNPYCVQESILPTIVETGTVTRRATEEAVKKDEKKKNLYEWSINGVFLASRTKEKVECEGFGGDQTVALVYNTQPHDQRTGQQMLIIKLAEGLVILLLLCTALISASRVHNCLTAGNTMAVTCVLYSTYYLVHLLCDTEGTRNSVLACWQCGALQMFLLLSVSIFILCAAAGLHVAVEDSYDVEFFIHKSSVLSLGIPLMFVACLGIADLLTSKQYTSLFLTADSLTDESPLGCRISLPLRYGVVVAPQLFFMVVTFVVLYRLKMNILGEKYEEEKLEKATKHLSFIHALLMVVIMFSINSAITATSVTTQDGVLIYIYVAFNLLQAITIFYCIGFHCTPLVSYMTDSAKRRREALLQDMADQDSKTSIDESEYEFDSETSKATDFSWTTGTSMTVDSTRENLSVINDEYIQQESTPHMESKGLRFSKRVSFYREDD